MRALITALLLTAAAFSLRSTTSAAASFSVGTIYTVPQCLTVTPGNDLLVGSGAPPGDDCLFATGQYPN